MDATVSDTPPPLSNERCDAFRSMPGDFRTMVRAIYAAGWREGRAGVLAVSDEDIDDLLAALEVESGDGRGVVRRWLELSAAA